MPTVSSHFAVTEQKLTLECSGQQGQNKKGKTFNEIIQFLKKCVFFFKFSPGILYEVCSHYSLNFRVNSGSNLVIRMGQQDSNIYLKLESKHESGQPVQCHADSMHWEIWVGRPEKGFKLGGG